MGTFLHTRRFLSYHAHRFTDESVCLPKTAGGMQAVLPAALDPADGTAVVSHPGITYGGLLHDDSLTGMACLKAFEEICEHYAARGLRRLRYKAVPHVYHRMPAHDDLYALFRLGADLYRRDLSCAIDLAARATPAQRRRRSFKKALAAGVQVIEGFEHLSDFWSILEENLASRHGAKPVHTLDEIILLRSRFPGEIRLLVALLQGEVVAGTLLFDTERVSHAQYIASSAQGRDAGALDAVFEAAIAYARRDGRRYFDFGISTEEGGRELNAGLYDFKAEFGGAGVAHDFYEIRLA